MSVFVGRTHEYQKLKSFIKNTIASFIVLKGRRRVGKSTLVEHFSREFPHCYTFTGLAPEKNVNASDQRKEFCRQFSKQFNIPNPNFDDWGDIFWALAERVKSGRILLFFDEISWMAEDDPTFLPKLKDAWDRFYKKNNKLMLIVCGSASSWIDRNMLSNTGFLGRVSYIMTVMPLALNVCKEFWGQAMVSAYEKLKVISVTGGIPRYLEVIQPQLTAEENIKRLCFTSGGLLVDEFEKIFNDLFLHQSDFYRNIAFILSNGAKQFTEICQELSLKESGRISDYLKELEEVGFIKRYYNWSIKTGLEKKISLYRLSDNYLRFYFKYIEPNRRKIKDNKFAFQALSALPAWDSMMALQVENLVINNRDLLVNSLGINLIDIVADGPYFQRGTKRIAGCQIDYMVQTKYNTLYICEIKFSKSPIQNSIVQEVKDKINRLVIPKGFSVRPVLIHVNGINDMVEECQFFSEIVNITSWI